MKNRWIASLFVAMGLSILAVGCSSTQDETNLQEDFLENARVDEFLQISGVAQAIEDVENSRDILDERPPLVISRARDEPDISGTFTAAGTFFIPENSAVVLRETFEFSYLSDGSFLAKFFVDEVLTTETTLRSFIRGSENQFTIYAVVQGEELECSYEVTIILDGTANTSGDLEVILIELAEVITGDGCKFSTGLFASDLTLVKQ